MRKLAILGCVSVTGVGGIATTLLAQQQQVLPPKARYVMDVSTSTGLAALGSGIGAGLSMMMGGGGDREARAIVLRLGSTLPSTGAAKADHFVPPVTRMGKSLPLVGDRGNPSDEPDSVPAQLQKPKGRILIFWGCSERAAKGQPVVIDIAKIGPGMKAGGFPAGMFTSRVPIDRGPTLATSRTYGAYPNLKSGKAPPRGSSLLGPHRIVSTYAPEINFTLAQDYMPGLVVRDSPSASGGVALNWSRVASATGYYAWSFGGRMGADGQMGDIVIWSSSNAREMGGGLWEWLSPATVARLVTEKVVMPPSQTSCTIPAEVKAASPGFMMGNMNAYGPEANFAYPPRPSDPKIAWKPDWTTRVRFKSTTSWMGGMPGMNGASLEDGSTATDQPRVPQPKCGMIRRAAGLC